jgi:hypothetical protein
LRVAARGISRTFDANRPGEVLVLALLLALLLVALFFGLGFAVKWLFFVALVLAVVWVIGFFAASGANARWYRW